MIIDSHQHYMIPTAMQLEKLREAGVDKAVLFCSAPHPEKASNLAEIRADITALYKILAGGSSMQEEMDRISRNIDDIVSVIRKYPDIFIGFGSAPFGLAEKEMGDWVDTKIVANNLKGVGEFTPSSDEQISSLNNLFTVLSDMDHMPVWVHTFHPVTMAGITSLMDLCKKYSGVPVIFGHLGGVDWMDVIEFAKQHSNAYLDLSGTFSHLAVKMAIHEVPERCLFSSDAPYGEPKLMRRAIEHLSDSQRIADMVLGENIQHLLDL